MEWVQTIAGIGIVFSLLALLYWAAHRINGRSGFGRRSGRIEILERLPLGEKRSLLLVRVGREQMLIGATSHSITILSPVEGQEPDAEPAAATVPGPDLKGTFRNLLEALR